MPELIFEHYAALCLDRLLPGAVYYGMVGSEESYGRLTWIDERPKPTWAEIYTQWPAVKASVEWEIYKNERYEAILVSTVQVGEWVFDADEDSQNRMNRAITIMTNYPEVTTVRWRLNDNTEVMVDLATMLEALKAACQNQSDLWFPQQP